MALSLSELRNNLKKSENKQSNSQSNDYYPYWELPVESQAIIRFLPDKNKDNPYGFFIEKKTHTLVINGENKTVPCMDMYGEKCPICKVSYDYYTKGDKANQQKYSRKTKRLSQVLVIDDPLQADQNGESNKGKVKLFGMVFQIYNIIKEAIMNEDDESMMDVSHYAYQGGTNFVLKRSKQGQHSSYMLSKFSRKSSDLSDDMIELVEDKLIDLSTLIPKKPDIDSIKKMLEASLTGNDYETEESDGKFDEYSDIAKNIKSDSLNDDDDFMFTKTEKSSKPPQASVVDRKKQVEDDDYEVDADALLQRIRDQRSSRN